MRILLVEDDALDAAAFRRGLPTATDEWAKTLHEAVERTGGSIGLVQHEGRGAAVEFTWPAAPAVDLA